MIPANFMSLNSGTRIGAYEVVTKLGEGGMGQVYQARDPKLNRNVALKILPPAFASDADRLARFKREAQVLASLNHPNIAAIYGFEDATNVHALVMELVPGRTLAELVTSPVTVADALPIARQIASALEAAHEQGIVHRDLKPANIKITDGGAVKVLDFGLAKAVGTGGTEGSGAHGATGDSATLTSPAMTEMGMILGTAGYMAPEQARGKPVDRRADLWAFGVILFEMLAGKALYRGETVTDTIAHVITQPPDWNLLPAATPAGVRRLLKRCLEKDPRNRLQSAGDARIEIDELIAGAGADSQSGSVSGVSAGAAGASGSDTRRRSALLTWLPWGVAAALLMALLFVLWPKPRVLQPLQKLDVRVASGHQLFADPDNDGEIIVLSPDGQRLVYAGSTGTVRRLYSRPLDSLVSQPIAGTDGASQPFFSPDGKSLGFLGNGTLMRTQLAGGTPTPIVSAAAMRGATWGPGDTIVYTGDMTAGLSRISAAGGTATPLTTLKAEERTHRWPSFLPNGKAVLFACQMSSGSYDDGTIEAVRLDTGERKVLVKGGSFPRYAASGHLLYVKQNNIYAVPFDPESLEVRGEGKPVLTGVSSSGQAVGAGSGNGAAQVAVASNGIAVYLPVEEQQQANVRLAIVDRTGKVTFEYPEQKAFRDPRFSPDGRRVAVRVISGRTEHLHILDIERGTLTQIIFDGQYSGLAVWNKAGDQIAYASDRGARGLEVFLGPSDGTGERKQITSGQGTVRVPTSFSPDGRLLAFFEVNAVTNMDIMVLSLADGKITPFLKTPAIELGGAFSPDGKWMAYQSIDSPDGSGRTEVFLRAYPDGGALRQVSNGGGTIPNWTKQGSEIVYVSGQSVMSVDVKPEGNALSLGKPRPLFPLPVAEPLNALYFDAFPDGNKFAALLTADTKTVPEPRTNLTMVFNLFDEIRRITGKN